MALDGDTLGDLMLAAIDTLSDTDKRNRQKVFRKLGGAIVSHLTASAVVSPSGTPTALTAPAGGGLVTGTGKIQ